MLRKQEEPVASSVWPRLDGLFQSLVLLGSMWVKVGGTYAVLLWVC